MYAYALEQGTPIVTKSVSLSFIC